jgi:glycerol-3-phosphate acyltransferase PlsX
LRVALDALGGDLAPVEAIKGALLAAEELGVDVILVGPPALVERELAKYPRNNRISVVEAADAIQMGEDEIVKAVRTRPNASINVAMKLVKTGEADAMVSAGNTGAVMASAFFVLGRIPGVERPALSTLIPFNAGRVFLLDAGANADCRPSYLVQFAQMGTVYSREVVGVANPRVGLLNTGEESGKGNETIAEAYDLLKQTGLNFVGNIEGQNVHKGLCDVVVADGFTGNVALKVGEGMADYILQQVRSVIRSSILYAPAAILLKPALRRALKSLQYEEYGGGNLLGVNGVVVVAHGRSDAVAIKNALRVANASAASDLMMKMREIFAQPGEPSAAGR